ncbi:DNA double-strand break repair protein Mre11 [Methanosarcina siciliae C2J]|uniref:DNA double-strand break repair protein Mre11 n=1 Tax=Methanosarcina siciliae C2J TaxID=1434118 RepID=A0A0E3PN07_9EURY|nr:exonuclease SbcCD subunit D [Methanosarcina siciliae]AKB36317.1 DNA double-strand break repair protein Mre11 [Methanosarcina siciliae C2J]
MKKRELSADTDRNGTLSFVHAADLHLDSPFVGISGIDQELGERLAKATFQAYEAIIELCMEEEVDFLLIAGDVYDSADKSLYAQVRFIEGLRKLETAGIQIFICHGNHDPLDGWSASLKWPANVHTMRGDKAEVVEFKKEGETAAFVVGMSYPTRHIMKNLVKDFPKKEDYWPFTIGLLHCSVGSYPEHDPYAPCTLQDLREPGYDYWALGHIHTPSVVCKEAPVVIYPGNPQGRHPGETGARGCCLVNVSSGGAISTKFVETDSVRWHIREVSIEGLEKEGELVENLQSQLDEIRENSGGRSAICRLVLSGRGPLHRTLREEGFLEDLLRTLREDEIRSRQFAWVERIENETLFPIERELLLKREDFVGDLVKIVEGLKTDEEALDEFHEVLAPLFKPGSGGKQICKIDDEEMKSLLQCAENILLDALLTEEDHEN